MQDFCLKIKSKLSAIWNGLKISSLKDLPADKDYLEINSEDFNKKIIRYPIENNPSLLNDWNEALSDIPSSYSTKIIFKFNPEINAYDISDFYLFVPKGINIQKEDIEIVLNELKNDGANPKILHIDIQKAKEGIWVLLFQAVKKTVLDNISFKNYLICVFWGCVGFLCMISLVLFMTFLVWFAVPVAGFLFYRFVYLRNSVNKLRVSVRKCWDLNIERLEKILERYNETEVFKKYGVSWSIGKFGAWVEMNLPSGLRGK